MVYLLFTTKKEVKLKSNGFLIKTLRQEAGYTQEEFAQVIKYTTRSVQRMENGDAGKKLIAATAKFFKRKPEELKGEGE
jgi:DNA-binding XRE family transcriptional regulator